MENSIRGSSWKGNHPPKKILAIRFQALGDTIITLPYLQSLKRQYPQLELHFLTRREVSLIPKNITLFDKVIVIDGGRNLKLQLLFTLIKLPWLWLQGYDAVIDLQNHTISRLVRKAIAGKAWTEFDRSSPMSAGDRTRITIEALWSWRAHPDTRFEIQNQNVVELLRKNGWEPDHDLVVLNPAGAFPSRNWPLENYVAFAKLWLKSVNTKTQFVLLLLPSRQDKSEFIAKSLGKNCVNLTGLANPLEAFAVLQKSKLVLSEDSGLMHMAWTQGVPTLALFSSSRKDWSAPQGEWSYCFDSSDMECGPCMKEVCQFGDNRCLTRYTPEIVLQKAISLYEKK